MKQDCHRCNPFCSTICGIIMLLGSCMYNVISRQTYGHRFTQYMATYCVCLQPVAFIFMEFVAYVEYIYMWHICGIYMWHIHTPPSPLHCSPRALAPYFWPLVPPALCQPDSPCRQDRTCMIFVQTFTRPQFWEQKLYAVDKTYANATVTPNMYSGPG